MMQRPPVVLLQTPKLRNEP